MMEMWVAIQQRLRYLCLEQDMTIHKLAECSGLPPSTVYSILNGKSKNPGVMSIQSVCNGLKVSMKYFFDDDLFENDDNVSA